jgi:bifunctional DNase/RNase
MVEESRCSSPGCRNQVTVFALCLTPNGTPSDLSLCDAHLGNLGPELMVPDPACVDTRLLGNSFEACVLKTVLFQHNVQRFTLVLESRESQSVFLFPTGFVEASWVRFIAAKASYLGPSTHDLMLNILDVLGGTLVEAVVDGYDKNTRGYECHVVVRTADGASNHVKCRASDGVAFSLASGFPFKVHKAFLGYPV